MNVFESERIRNVVLLGHGGAGKTTLVEAMAHVTGITSRQGKITDGNTISDFDKEEIRRLFSISTTCSKSSTVISRNVMRYRQLLPPPVLHAHAPPGILADSPVHVPLQFLFFLHDNK